MSGPVSSAVVSEAASRITSLITGKYSEHKNVHEWMHRLEMACIEIKSALAFSHTTCPANNEDLHKWQEMLKEAVCEAEETLSYFKGRVLCEKPNPTIEGGSSSHDQLTQEEGSDDVTLLHPISNLSEAVAHQEEGSHDATLVHPASNRMWCGLVIVDFNGLVKSSTSLLSHYQSMQPYDASFNRLLRGFSFIVKAVLSTVVQPLQFICLGPHIENDEKVSKLIKTMEKLEKMTGNHIGNFIKLLKLQKKRKMSRKRKRSGVALQGFFLVLSLKLQTYALFFYGEDPHLLVIKLFCANRNVPTGITGDIFIGFFMKSSWISFAVTSMVRSSIILNLCNICLLK